jgi:phosphoribosylamine--glycine ligase
MRVLVVGSGGREHALVWKIAQSASVKEIICAPGNAGIAEQAECVPVKTTDIKGLADLAAARKVALTVVGPEAPLAEGIVDEFRSRGLPVFGPDRAAARIESSKVFAKELMAKYGIPTAEFAVFDDADRALGYLRARDAPMVVKADGLAAGKGVTIARTREEAENAVRQAMIEQTFGAAGRRVIVEECLEGQELSLMAFAHGTAFLPMQPVQDHKAVYDGDRGPNTGGMGCYSPVPVADESVQGEALETVIKPTLAGLASEGCPFSGVLYAGLILTSEGLKVLEFNCRFGDPEPQAIAPLMESDLVELLVATIEGRLDETTARFSQDACVCVVMASGGYPGSYETGKRISGLDEARRLPGVTVFHAGTEKRDGDFVTAGGRVLGVTATGAGFAEAIERAYGAVDEIRFEGAHWRTDIGRRALEQEQACKTR